MNEVETHIYVLGAGVVLVVARERDRGLIVAEHCRGVFEGAEYLGEEAAQPERLLYTVRRCDVVTLPLNVSLDLGLESARDGKLS